MTLYQYLALDQSQQMDALWNSGVYVLERDDATFRYIVYSLFSFFVELKYHRNDNALVGCRAFRNDSQLEPYLPNIDISEIIQKLY